MSQPTLVAYSRSNLAATAAASNPKQRQHVVDPLKSASKPQHHMVRVCNKSGPQMISLAGPNCRRQANPLDCRQASSANGWSMSSSEQLQLLARQHKSKPSNKGPQNGEPVILMLDDRQVDAIGWPVIGRRLPGNKAESRLHRTAEFQPVQSMDQMEPVVGRRGCGDRAIVQTGQNQQQLKYIHHGSQLIRSDTALQLIQPIQLVTLDANCMNQPRQVAASKYHGRANKPARLEILQVSSGGTSVKSDACPLDQICSIPNCGSCQFMQPDQYCCCCQKPNEGPRIHLHPPPLSPVTGSDAICGQICCSQLTCCSKSEPNPDIQARRARPKESHRHSEHKRDRTTGCEARRSGRQPIGHNRSSSCHERSSSSGRNHHHHHHRRERGSSRVSPPPIPMPKPQTHMISVVEFRDQDHGKEFQPSAESLLQSAKQQNRTPSSSHQRSSVNCMYDSLAAELKAKLGDPKLAPILLPPKDYDTISRKQGKLSDIELRRSTNPQLVGQVIGKWIPNVNNNNNNNNSISNSKQVTNHKITLSSQQTQTPLEKTEKKRVNLARSRSNSSSGLGSVSAGGQSSVSPTSTHSSSHDDIGSQSKLHLESTRDEYLSNTGSDSGHSGSGQMDSHLSEADNLTSRASSEPKTQNCHSLEVSDKNFGPRPKETRDLNHQAKVSTGILWNGRVEVPLKVNNNRNGGQVYLATKQIIY